MLKFSPCNYNEKKYIDVKRNFKKVLIWLLLLSWVSRQYCVVKKAWGLWLCRHWYAIGPVHPQMSYLASLNSASLLVKWLFSYHHYNWGWSAQALPRLRGAVELADAGTWLFTASVCVCVWVCVHQPGPHHQQLPFQCMTRLFFSTCSCLSEGHAGHGHLFPYLQEHRC
jgi:hypothetical protein